MPESYHPLSPVMEGAVTEATEPIRVESWYWATTLVVTDSGEAMEGTERAMTVPVVATLVEPPLTEKEESLLPAPETLLQTPLRVRVTEVPESYQ